MSKTIDNLTGTETLEELEALLAEAEQAEDLPTEPEADSQAEPTPTETDEEPAPSAAAEGEPDQGEASQDEQGEAKGIASKDGKHIIPYGVLEAERAEAKRLRAENEQLRAAQAERDKLQALLDKHGIEAESDELSMEQIEQLAEDYPDVGKALVGIARKLATMEQQAAPPTPAANPVADALDAVPELKAWQEGDRDRFTFAVTVDDQLKADPAFADKPLAVRFAEAARRTRIAFGDEAPAAKKEPAPKAKDVDAVPRSPGDLGQSTRAPTSQAERYQAMSQEQLMAEMSSMTPAQIEALLAEQGY